MSNICDISRQFTNEEVIASCSRCEVYRSTDGQSGDRVAVKLFAAVKPPSEVRLQRFIRDIDALKSLQLKGFPRILMHGFTPASEPFIVMAFITGTRLDLLHGISPANLVQALSRVADTLEVGARSGIQHGNLHPKNIFVVDPGIRNRICLLGLGTAQLWEFNQGPDSDFSSAEGSRYVAPERRVTAGGVKAEAWRSDLYSYAMTVVDVLDGRVQGAGESRPLVSLPADVCQVMDAPTALINALEFALRGDPGERKVGWAEVQRAMALKRELIPSAEVARFPPQNPAGTVLMNLAQLPFLVSAATDSMPEKETHASGVKTPPLACDDRFQTDAGVMLEVPLPGVLANDDDAKKQPLTADLVSGPKHGTLSLQKDGSFSFRPDPGFVGADSFSYRAYNGSLNSKPATVTIAVNPVNAPPLAFDKTYTTAQDEALEISRPGLLAPNLDDKSQTATATIVTPPANGGLDLSSDGSFCYVPNRGFHGVDTFMYRVSSGFLTSEPATVTVTVRPAEGLHEVKPQGVTRPWTTSAGDARQSRAESSPAPPAGSPPLSQAEPRSIPEPPQARVIQPPNPKPPPRVRKPPPLRHTPSPRKFETSPGTSLKPPPLPILRETPQSPPPPRPSFTELALEQPLILLIVGITAVLAGLVLMIVLWPDPAAENEGTVGSLVSEATADPTRPPLPTATPRIELHSRLVAAEGALVRGDTNVAREELAAITATEVEAFSEEEAGLYEHLVAAIEGGQREQAIEDLHAGLSRSTLAMIRRGLSGLSGISRQEILATPGLASEIERGRRALKLYSDMERARRSGDGAGLLESSAAMVRLLPGLTVAAEWREEAATLLENSSEEMAAEGQYQRAIADLEPISAHWPDRSGLSERLDRYRRMQDEAAQNAAAVEAYNAIVASALGRGEAGLPDEGLKMLESQTAPTQAEARRREAIRTLEAKLASLDAAAPTIALEPNTEFTLRKNQPLVVQVRVDDDYRVQKVTVRIRVEGSQQFEDWPCREIADTMYYTVEVDPATHQNGRVEMVIEARDLSGHVAQLGTPSQPMAFDRKGLFKRIVGD